MFSLACLPSASNPCNGHGIWYLATVHIPVLILLWFRFVAILGSVAMANALSALLGMVAVNVSTRTLWSATGEAKFPRDPPVLASLGSADLLASRAPPTIMVQIATKIATPTPVGPMVHATQPLAFAFATLDSLTATPHIVLNVLKTFTWFSVLMLL